MAASVADMIRRADTDDDSTLSSSAARRSRISSRSSSKVAVGSPPPTERRTSTTYVPGLVPAVISSSSTASMASSPPVLRPPHGHAEVRLRPGGRDVRAHLEAHLDAELDLELVGRLLLLAHLAQQGTDGGLRVREHLVEALLRALHEAAGAETAGRQGAVGDAAERQSLGCARQVGRVTDTTERAAVGPQRAVARADRAMVGDLDGHLAAVGRLEDRDPFHGTPPISLVVRHDRRVEFAGVVREVDVVD